MPARARKARAVESRGHCPLMCAKSLIDGRSSASLARSELIIMPQPASQGNDALSVREGRSRSKPSGVTRRDLVRLFGLAALAAFAPLALTGEVQAEAQRNLAIE